MKFQTIISLPPAAAACPLHGLRAEFAASDPPGRQLGSGGGTANLLDLARRALAPRSTLSQWLSQSPKLMIHASGQSRRLPAYAAEGKLRLPMPRIAGRSGQTPGQTLLDAQRNKEQYRDLIVRVAGYSAYFTTLTPGVQEDVISRTGHEL